MIPVHLTDDELRDAHTIAAARWRWVCAHNATPKGGRAPSSSLDINILGTCGELAVHKALGLPWDAAVEPQGDRPDVGPYEVKTTRHPSGRLIIRPDAIPDRPHLLVVARTDTDYELVGWITPAEVGDYPLESPNGWAPARWIPSHRLHQDLI